MDRAKVTSNRRLSSILYQGLRDKPSPETPFRKWYVDAFAGTGERTTEVETGGLLDGKPTRRERIQLEGSAKRALQIDPPFQHFVFVEANNRRFKALTEIKGENPERDIRCECGDANDKLTLLFNSPPWSKGPGSSLQRAVVFLDPYGMNVRWSTLVMLANTGRADVWYLFPLHAALRQLAHRHNAVDASKRASLTEISGTQDWENEFYREIERPGNLFESAMSQKDRQADPDKVEEYARKRLQTIFRFVSDPIPLLTTRGLRQFSLFCASGNPSPHAISLIERGVAAQIKKYGRGASRQRSAL